MCASASPGTKLGEAGKHAKTTKNIRKTQQNNKKQNLCSLVGENCLFWDLKLQGLPR